jgi:hypothetical protein
LSDVAATGADREGREWYPKTKFIANILMENGETKLVGEGRNWSHKTKKISGIIKETDKTMLINKGEQTHNDCEEEYENFFDCLDNDIEDDCADCINHFLEESDDHPFSCDEMADEGFCNDIYNCWDDECHKDCGSEVVEAVTCYFEHNTDCHDEEYEEQCTDSLSLMKSLI